MQDKAFLEQLADYRENYINGPTPLHFAKNLTDLLSGARIYFKREELAHTGAHKLNNSIGQTLLAKRMGKKRIIAETGAGQHGVATATACALLQMPCVIYMGAADCERQRLNVNRIKILGAQVIPVQSGGRRLKDAVNEALKDWAGRLDDTHYVVGSVIGAHPYPAMVRTFQSIIGKEAREQVLKPPPKGLGKLPDYLVACVGGGSNAIGLFAPFLNDLSVRLIGVEGGGRGGPKVGLHAASLTGGKPGVLHGSYTYLLQTKDGQIEGTESISAGLDYPGVGPELAELKEAARAQFEYATDREALEAFRLCARTEGIIPALEPSHALAYVIKLAKTLPSSQTILLNLCGRGDKDMELVSRAFEEWQISLEPDHM